VQKKPHTHATTVRIPNEVDIRYNSPSRSARRHTLTLQILQRSLARIVHCCLLPHRYKIQLRQELSLRDKGVRVQCCQTAFDMAQDNPDFMKSLLMSEGANVSYRGL
jgi:hypothetical protein